MKRSTRKALDKIQDTLGNDIAAVKPQIIMGDDDSIHLTPHQQGYIAGMVHAVRVIEEFIVDATGE